MAELEALKLLRALDEDVAAKTGTSFFEHLVASLAKSLDATCAFVSEIDIEHYRAYALAYWRGGALGEVFDYDLSGTPCECVLDNQIVTFPRNIRQMFPKDGKWFESLDAHSFLAIPLCDEHAKVRGHLAVLDSRERDWSEADIGVLRIFSLRAGTELERREHQRRLEARVEERTAELAAALAEVQALKSRLQQENRYLRQELGEIRNLGEIIGSSPLLQAALRKVAAVAATDSTVLIHGETGTGKELFARALHAQSRRRDRPMIKLNCSAISAGLVESELFGHIKGAFTGATDKRMGRFQLADGGTLFLDEVSELPPETQAKLLRVLQEQEFEPVGSSTSIKVDVRVVAATNRDLLADVHSGRFRSDLFYRLNVFPIALPSLRERPEDIATLATHFMQRMARKLGKPIERIAPATLARLNEYSWPGNIRDLQNTIERAAILANGDELIVDWDLGPAASLLNTKGQGTGVQPRQSQPSPASPPEAHSLEAIAREHIIAVLRKTRGVVEGPDGAARLLDMNPSTVRFRMKKLGISKIDYLGDPAARAG